jgi:uncharacterized protein (TIGR02271 family)
MNRTLTIQRIAELRGAPVYDAAGDKIGKIDEIYYDYETREPEFIGIGTGLFGSKRALVPANGADAREDGVYVPFPKDQIKDAPDIDDEEISDETAQALAAHYGLSYSHERSGTGMPEGQPQGTAPGRGRGGREGTVTRHEEELAVGKQPVEAGRARLRKWVETEPVEMDVELRQETARVTREPVDEPVGDAELGEDEFEVPLRGEEPVVQKRTVAKERVGVEKDLATTKETVGEEVRKERVDVEGDVRKK